MSITIEMKNELLDILKMKKVLGIKYIEDITFPTKELEISELPDDIESLEEYVSNCSLCELSKSKIESSFSSGDSSSEIYLIGLKNDTKDEKELSVLHNMFQNVLKIDIKNIYITNILKCSVKIYKNNLDDEIAKCINYLKKQIELANPKIIIVFGKAFNYLMNSDENILDISGNSFIYNNTQVIPLLDIDFINKNPSYKERMFTDLKKLKKVLDQK